MSIFDTLADSGITQEDLEKAASARLFAEAAAAEGIDLSELSEEQAEELYAFWADDSEKNASANAFFEAAAAEGIDLNELTEDQVGELYNYWATGGEEVEKAASAEELLQEAAVKEASAKLAEAEYIGRYMARVYADEMNKIAGDEQTWGDALKSLPKAVHDRVGQLGAAMGHGHGAGYAALAGGAGLAAGGAYGAKKLLDRRRAAKAAESGEKQSSAFDEAVDEAALELLKEAGFFGDAARRVRTAVGKASVKDRALNARDAAVKGGKSALEFANKHKKEIGAGAALAGAGGVGFAAGRMSKKSPAASEEKKASAFDAIVEERALEMLKEAEEEAAKKSMMERLKGVGSSAHGLVGSLGERLGAEAGKGHMRGYGALGTAAALTAGGAYGGKKLLDRRRAAKAAESAEKQSSIDELIEARALEMIEEAELAEELDQAALNLLAENGLI